MRIWIGITKVQLFFAIASFAIALAGVANPATAGTYNERVIYSFCAQTGCADGQAPRGKLAMDAHGNLFGVTADGGDFNGDGVIYELIRKGDAWKYKKLHQFCKKPSCTDDRDPVGDLVLDVNGNLYGVTAGFSQGGTIFRLSAETGRWKLQTLVSFCPTQQNCIKGSSPVGGLTYVGAASGALYDGVSPLYGVTANGGSHNDGVAYELIPGSGVWTETVIYNFCSLSNCTDGEAPDDTLLADSGGNLFGTTTFGGVNTLDGTVFELSPANDGWSETVLRSFCNPFPCTDGVFPEGPLAMDASGNLLGTTALNGTGANGGVLYKLKPNGTNSEYSVLYNFCSQPNCSDGASPEDGVAIDARGNIFGVTEAGGNSDQFNRPAGVAFRLSGSKYKVIYSFCSAQPNCTDGTMPHGNLIMGPHGKFYGVAEIGGAFQGGAVYEISQ